MKSAFTLICLLSLSLTVHASPASITWNITSKTCGSNSVALKGKEQIILDSDFLTHTFQDSETKTQTCAKAEVFSRFTTAFSTSKGSYSETAGLMPLQQRTVCRSKADNSQLSDTKGAFSGPQTVISMKFSSTQGSADITGSPECQSGSLHIEMQK